ncbi:hypothetical protein R6Z07F_017603 [Ovis aries]
MSNSLRSMDCSPPGSSALRIFQARILEWVAMPSSRASCAPRDGTHVACIAGGFLTAQPPKPMKGGESGGEVTQSCPTLCDPVDCSPPGSSLHGILRARILEWVAISFSRGSSRPRDQTRVSRIAGRRFNLCTSREAHERHCRRRHLCSRGSSVPGVVPAPGPRARPAKDTCLTDRNRYSRGAGS